LLKISFNSRVRKERAKIKNLVLMASNKRRGINE